MAAEPPAVTVVVPTRDRPELLRRAVDGHPGPGLPGPGRVRRRVRPERARPALVRAAGRPPPGAGHATSAPPAWPAARNSGILAATGELVAFCDDDDEWLPEKLASAGRRGCWPRPAAAVSTTGILVRYQDRTTTRLAPTDLVTPPPTCCASRLTELHPSTVLVRAPPLLDDIGLVDEQIPGSYAEDYEWLLRAARHAPGAGRARAPGR